jgi:hypothetical protein
MERRASPPGVSLLQVFFFCRRPRVAYPLSVKGSVVGNAGVEKTRAGKAGGEKARIGQARVGTAALGRPSRAKLGRLLAGGGRSPT